VGFHFSDFEVDLERQELRRAGAVVHIEPQVFDVLVQLIRNRDRVVGKDELIDTVWQGRIVSESTLSSRISAARRALGDNGNEQSFIRTLHKRGFRFVGTVEEIAAISMASSIVGISATDQRQRATDHGEAPLLIDQSSTSSRSFDHGTTASNRESDAISLIASADDASPHDSSDTDAAPISSVIEDERPARSVSEVKKPRLVRRALQNWMVATPMLVFAGLMLTTAWLETPPSESRIAPPKGAAVATGTALASVAQREGPIPPSIVVVPFINLSGDAKQDHVADGVTDSLISDLARALPGIAVVSRDTAFTYKGRGVDARQIGRELEVRYLLSGSVAIEGEKARVNMQLVDTTDASQLWAERFDIERKSILQVQDEIVSRVSRATGLKVVDFEARRSRRERPSSTELVDLVLRGKAVLNLPSTPATMIEARGLFEQALKVQQNDSDALAGVATTLVFEFVNGYYEMQGDERLQRAESLLDQAGEADPRNLMVLKARAALRRAQGKFEDAIAAAETVIVENPGEPWAYKEIGLSTIYLGRAEQALDWFAKADRIGPRDPGRWTWLDGRGHGLILLGREKEAVRFLISAIDANPRNFSSHAFLAAAYGLLGRVDEARASLAVYLQNRPGTRISTFRRLSPVPFVLTSPTYRQQHERVSRGLRIAGLPE
jgi:TolB-like protein/DNA-binding winged helix-turn-helix (wHTH) protein